MWRSPALKHFNQIAESLVSISFVAIPNLAKLSCFTLVIDKNI
jgi:hypothetical protein